MDGALGRTLISREEVAEILDEDRMTKRVHTLSSEERGEGSAWTLCSGPANVRSRE